MAALLAALVTVVLAAPPAPAWHSLPLDGGGPVTALACSSVDAAFLLAGGLGSGILRSVDGGRSWAASDDGLLGAGDRSIAGIALSGTDARVAYCAAGTGSSDGGLLATTDGAQHWAVRSRAIHFAATGPLRQSSHVLFVETLDPGHLWAGTIDRGVCRSVDDGRTWESLGPEGRRITALARAADGTLYAAVAPAGGDKGALLRRRPGETAWATLLSDYGIDLALAGPARLLLVSANKGLLRSDDDGATWANVTPAGLDPREGGIATAPGFEQVGLVWGRGRRWQRVWLTLDSGTTWKQLIQPPPEIDCGDGWLTSEVFASDLRCATFDPHSPRRLWLGDSVTLWGSHDGAGSWFSGHNGLRTATVRALALDARHDGVAWLGTALAGAFRADADAGVVTALGGNGIEVVDVNAVAAPVRETGPPLLLGRGSGLWQWLAMNAYKAAGALPAPATDLQALSDGRVLAEVPGEPLKLSPDGGASWQPWSPQPLHLPVWLDAGYRHAAALAWDEGLWLSLDAGSNWNRIDADLPPLPWLPTDRLAGSAGADRPLYLSHGGALWRTRNRGRMWERMLPRAAACLAVQPDSGRVFLAPADSAGILTSDDEGETWAALPGAPTAPITVLLCDPRRPGRLWVATAGSGCWVADPEK